MVSQSPGESAAPEAQALILCARPRLPCVRTLEDAGESLLIYRKDFQESREDILEEEEEEEEEEEGVVSVSSRLRETDSPFHAFRVEAEHGYASAYIMGRPAREANARVRIAEEARFSEENSSTAASVQSATSEWKPLRRWECRVVTPCLAASVDCFSGEGCGLILCERPLSLFGSCCQVYPPENFAINTNSGLVMAREVIRVPPSLTQLPTAEEKPAVSVEELQKKLPSKKLILQDAKECPLNRRSKPLKIFVGTWNTEYQEFAAEFICHLEEQLGYRGERPMACVEWASAPSISSSSRSDSSIGASTACTADGPAVPPTVDSSETFASDANVQESSSDENDDSTKKEGAVKQPPSDARTLKRASQPDLLQRRSTMMLSKPKPGEQPLKDWIIPGYDVYVVTLQEVTNDNIFETLTLYLELEHGERFLRVDMGHGKIQGLGKGAWTTRKATSMACWIRESALYPRGPVKPVAFKCFSFTMINGSKGAVTLVLRMFDQLVCFIGCHMPASGVEERQRARKYIRRKLAQVYSNCSDVDFTRVFHHVVWAGDFNFRLQTSVNECLPLLRSFNIPELLKYDECREDRGLDMELHKMREAPVEFLPTYKKADGRPPLDRSDPEWVEKEYQMSMKKGMLGQRKIVQKPPSKSRFARRLQWCDRVFFWSMPEMTQHLIPEQNGYFAAEPKIHSVLLASDHAPVGCGFLLYDLPEGVEPPRTFLQSASDKKKRKSN